MSGRLLNAARGKKGMRHKRCNYLKRMLEKCQKFLSSIIMTLYIRSLFYNEQHEKKAIENTSFVKIVMGHMLKTLAPERTILK